jgi:hypothetical protein
MNHGDPRTAEAIARGFIQNTGIKEFSTDQLYDYAAKRYPRLHMHLSVGSVRQTGDAKGLLRHLLEILKKQGCLNYRVFHPSWNIKVGLWSFPENPRQVP